MTVWDDEESIMALQHEPPKFQKDPHLIMQKTALSSERDAWSGAQLMRGKRSSYTAEQVCIKYKNLSLKINASRFLAIIPAGADFSALVHSEAAFGSRRGGR